MVLKPVMGGEREVESTLSGLLMGKLLDAIIMIILSISAQAFYFWIAQIFVVKENRQGFFSLMGMVVAGNFLSTLAYLSVIELLFHILPLPSLFAIAAVYLTWILVVKYWYETSWGRALLLTILASALQLLTIYLTIPWLKEESPFRGVEL